MARSRRTLALASAAVLAIIVAAIVLDTLVGSDLVMWAGLALVVGAWTIILVMLARRYGWHSGGPGNG
ncbi:hypothetical protein [Actinomycetospora corticicola]|uniref:Uncharacterized protein involved in exopolysaccharide biosynthesis n=1 Tax=Actinomycetospora corticicola TaxID=663602 RepID=A0A7Y9J3S5_9PSEU|nr:hypothetical protein [Actinomycetospora corticicola]NYD34358.1 uncharacterized protein involved in exopolysaccharide biosynthesis [Actinomycetospora corticicola]